MRKRREIVATCLIVAALLSGCQGRFSPSVALAPLASPAPPGSSADLKAFPVAGAQNHIFIAGTVGSDRRATLVGADTPYGHAELSATSGCIGGGHEPLPQWRIEAGGSIDLVVGSGYLAVWVASGLPDQGSEMPVTLRFSDAPDVRRARRGPGRRARVAGARRSERLPRLTPRVCVRAAERIIDEEG